MKVSENGRNWGGSKEEIQFRSKTYPLNQKSQSLCLYQNCAFGFVTVYKWTGDDTQGCHHKYSPETDKSATIIFAFNNLCILTFTLVLGTTPSPSLSSTR